MQIAVMESVSIGLATAVYLSGIGWCVPCVGMDRESVDFGFRDSFAIRSLIGHLAGRQSHPGCSARTAFITGKGDRT